MNRKLIDKRDIVNKYKKGVRNWRKTTQNNKDIVNFIYQNFYILIKLSVGEDARKQSLSYTVSESVNWYSLLITPIQI